MSCSHCWGSISSIYGGQYVEIKILAAIGLFSCCWVCWDLVHLSFQSPNAAKFHENGEFIYWYDRTDKSWFLIEKNIMGDNWKEIAKAYGLRAELEKAIPVVRKTLIYEKLKEYKISRVFIIS